MNCEFCGRETFLSHYENSKETAVYDCKHCPVLTSFYVREADSFICKIAFLLNRGAKAYIWTNNFVKNTSYISDISPDSGSIKDPLLFKAPKTINLTPQNVREKLSMYMTFL